jgi:hypothetical protein
MQCFGDISPLSSNGSRCATLRSASLGNSYLTSNTLCCASGRHSFQARLHSSPVGVHCPSVARPSGQMYNPPRCRGGSRGRIHRPPLACLSTNPIALQRRLHPTAGKAFSATQKRKQQHHRGSYCKKIFYVPPPLCPLKRIAPPDRETPRQTTSPHNGGQASMSGG